MKNKEHKSHEGQYNVPSIKDCQLDFLSLTIQIIYIDDFQMTLDQDSIN